MSKLHTDERGGDLERIETLLTSISQKLAEATSMQEIVDATGGCTLCGDTGWQPAEDERVKRCYCREKARAISIALNSGIPRQLLKTMNMREMQRPNDNYEQAWRQAVAWLEGWSSLTKQGLMLWGKPGTGKTRILVSILRYLILYHRVVCHYFDWRSFLSLLRSCYDDRISAQPHSEQQLVKAFVEPAVVALDELTLARTEWEREIMLMLINERYLNGGVLLVGTNHDPAELAACMDGRTVSRLAEMTKPLYLDGPDYRRVQP